MATEPRAIHGNNSGSVVTYTVIIIGVNGLLKQNYFVKDLMI